MRLRGDDHHRGQKENEFSLNQGGFASFHCFKLAEVLISYMFAILAVIVNARVITTIEIGSPLPRGT